MTALCLKGVCPRIMVLICGFLLPGAGAGVPLRALPLVRGQVHGKRHHQHGSLCAQSFALWLFAWLALPAVDVPLLRYVAC